MMYSEATGLAWEIARGEAGLCNAYEIEPAHLLMGIAKLCEGDANGCDADEIARVRAFFADARLDGTSFRRRLRHVVTQPGDRLPLPGHRSATTKLVFGRAEKLATPDEAARPVLQLRHLLQALFESDNPPWAFLLAEMGVADPLAHLVAAKGRRATPWLDRFGRDLTQLAAEHRLDPIIGRESEIRQLARALIRPTKRNAILLGDAGVGKTRIVEGLAQHVASANPPPLLGGMRIVEVSLNALISGTEHRGMFEERLGALIAEASADDEIILFIDEIHTLLGAGGHAGSASDAAQILKPALARGALRLIGATTLAEYRTSIEKDAALARRFQEVIVDEPDRDEAVAILAGLRPRLEAGFPGVRITDDAIVAAVDLSRRYIPDRRLPDKAVDLLEQACTRIILPSISPWSATPVAGDVGRTEVAAVLAKQHGLPLAQLTEDETQRLLAMEEVLGRRVIGQEEAVRTVAAAARAAHAGFNDPHRPLGVLLFVGATGTGKTELAKALAEFLFHDERRLIRLDMSEYKDRYDVSRLIGAPPGYIGYDEEGQLTGPVRRKPYSVVLLDEVEKAHPEVLHLFLQVLDEGHLTDAHGRRVSFKDTIIILTSNLGAAAGYAGARQVGFAVDAARMAPMAEEVYRKHIEDALQATLSDELRNRIGQVVVFYPLDAVAIRRIVDRILDGLRVTLAERYARATITLSEDAYALLMERGMDPQYGAREMKRAVERLVKQPLVDAFLEGRFGPGAAIRVERRSEKLALTELERDEPPSGASGLAWDG